MSTKDEANSLIRAIRSIASYAESEIKSSESDNDRDGAISEMLGLISDLAASGHPTTSLGTLPGVMTSISEYSLLNPGHVTYAYRKGVHCYTVGTTRFVAT